MARCECEGFTNSGRPIWGTWITEGIEDDIVKFCRKTFGKKYRNMWIQPVYFDDKYFRYTDEFFAEVGVLLYPKISKLPKKTPENEFYYRTLVWEIVHKDIDTNIKNGVEPISIIIKGVRYSDNGKYIEKIKSVRRERLIDF